MRDCALQLEDERQRVIFERIQAGKARFYVVKDNIAHAKLYLLEADDGERRRVVVGSANLSERAFGGKQPETLVVWKKADAFGRTSIKGEIPYFLYDDTSSVGDTFVLWREQTEEFLGTRIVRPGIRRPWAR